MNYILKSAPLLILCIIIVSCQTAQKLLDKAERKDAAIVAKYARDKYPCTDLLKNDTAIIWRDSTIYIECPDNSNPFEVVTVRTDTVNNIVTRVIKVPVKVQLPGKIVTRWYEDSGKLKVAALELNGCIEAVKKLQAANDKLQAANDKLEGKIARKSKENWIWRIIILCWLIWKGIKIYRKIMIKI
jgi:hypothetical protein